MKNTKKENKQEYKEKSNDNQTVEQIIDNMTLMDDDLMSRCFDGNIPATEYMLRVILNRDIHVIKVKGQSNYKNPIVGGRNIQIDIEAEEENGERFDTEVQRNNQGAHVRRARFHSSMMDVRMLKKKQEFKQLKDSYVIFITERDFFKRGEPIYEVHRVIRGTGEEFEDGSHIIYVNGNYQGKDDIGKLVHDLRCKQADDIYNPELADSVRHFKEGEGRREMCEAVEKYAKEKEKRGEKRGQIKTIIQMGIRHSLNKETIIEDLLSQVEGMSEEEALETYEKYTGRI